VGTNCFLCGTLNWCQGRPSAWIFRAELTRQLDQLGVRVLTATTLDSPPGTVQPFTGDQPKRRHTRRRPLVPCYGTAVTSDYLCPELAAARRPGGRLAVTEHLRVTGHDGVFAVGDLDDTHELKWAAPPAATTRSPPRISAR
jgi:NADH dehydrogenase FAD-containing subunit